MEKWRKKLYENYSTNKGKNSEKLSVDCSFFNYKIKKLLPFDKSISIIDLAAGHGALLKCLEESGYTNIKGIDFSEEEVMLAKKLGVDKISKRDIFSFFENNKDNYDVIFLMDILEHLKREEIFTLLELVYKYLNKEGVVILQVPNAGGIFGMRILYGDLTHEIAFTHNSLKQVLTTTGFNEITFFEASPITKGLKGYIRFILWHLLVIPHRLILILETGIRKHILSQNIIVKAKKTMF